ncbi:MAG: hypothetical protein CMJ75_21860 [Planctomycetaceae bacterium]|nr:hypothetical protein [Planctomycetaceae bacterium]
MTKVTVLESTPDEMLELTKVQSDDRCILTLYFPGDRDALEKAKCKLSELPNALLGQEGLTEDEQQHLDQSGQLWKTAVEETPLASAVGWVAVVSWVTEEVWLMKLPAAVEPAAYLDNSPYLLPAGRLLDDLESYAVVYADHTRATIYLAALGRIQEEGRLRGDIKNHVRKGGWSQQRYERRRDKEIHHYCVDIITKLRELMKSESIRRIALAGDRQLLRELENRMHVEMQKQVVCRMPMEGEKDPRDVFSETLAAAAAEEQREEAWLHNAIVNEHARGGKAVIGPQDTLAALHERRVRWLIVGELADVEFFRCGGCGEAGLGPAETCSKCGEETYPQSAANEFLDLAFAGRSRVEFAAGDLTDVQGVAALLRW